MLGGAHSNQLAQNDPDAPSSGINFAHMGGDEFYAFDMMSLNDSQVSIS